MEGENCFIKKFPKYRIFPTLFCKLYFFDAYTYGFVEHGNDGS